jgi:hypothetical protein
MICQEEDAKTGQRREVEEKIWLVSFLDFDLGYFEDEEGRIEPGANPFQTKLLTMSSE